MTDPPPLPCYVRPVFGAPAEPLRYAPILPEPEVVEGEVVDDAPSGHEVETGEGSGYGWARCACGQWEAVVTGPSSARWAFADYRRHLAAVGLG